MAAETAEGPGIGMSLILFLTHSLTKTEPGSEIVGVPASEISDIIFSLSSSFKILTISLSLL